MGEFAVEDTGEGIAPRSPRTIYFDRFDPAWDWSHGGSGIGLSLTKALVDAHGGRISLDSAGPDKGSRFPVRLPSESP